jgi:hypothetical protein
MMDIMILEARLCVCLCRRGILFFNNGVMKWFELRTLAVILMPRVTTYTHPCKARSRLS